MLFANRDDDEEDEGAVCKQVLSGWAHDGEMIRSEIWRVFDGELADAPINSVNNYSQIDNASQTSFRLSCNRAENVGQERDFLLDGTEPW